jgi:hypothetical protein
MKTAMSHALLMSMIFSLFCFMLIGCAGEMKKGSDQRMYTIATVLEVNRKDIGKDIQLTLNQKLMFNMENDPARLGTWEMVEYDPRILLLLSDTPRTAPGVWGVLLEARALGAGDVKLRFTPSDEKEPPENVLFQISVRR